MDRLSRRRQRRQNIEVRRALDNYAAVWSKKEKRDVQQNSSGIGLLGVLFIVFLVLKLTGNISWSWWWVTAPLWGLPAILIGAFIIGAAIYGIYLLVEGIVLAVADAIDRWRYR